jgi:hypothetical protein
MISMAEVPTQKCHPAQKKDYIVSNRIYLEKSYVGLWFTTEYVHYKISQVQTTNQSLNRENGETGL